MATLNGPTAITAVTTFPNVVPSDPSLKNNVFSPAGGNAIEILGKASAGAGRLFLLRSLGPTSNEWYPVDDDAQDLKSIQVDSTKPAAIPGFFSGIWLAGDLAMGGTAEYVVFSDGGATLAKLYAAPRRV